MNQFSPDGINGNVGGEVTAVKEYVRCTREHPSFAEVDFKRSPGTGAEFQRLSVKVRDELVTFGAGGELKVGPDGVLGGGRRLDPADLHALVAERGDDVAFFDGRNRFEAEIGRFRGAVVPDVATTKDFVSELDSGRYDDLRHRPVVTYCTGGIRCEVLTSLMVNRGFTEVYQLDGGIVGYGEAYGDDGLWEGSLYVFDDRISVTFSDHAAVIGHCEVCAESTSAYRDCTYPSCKGRALLCGDHADEPRCEAHR